MTIVLPSIARFALLSLSVVPLLTTSFQPTFNIARKNFISTSSLKVMSDSSSSTTTSSLNHINGVQSIADSYSIFLLDMWGVMHNGSEPYEGVIDNVKKLRESGKQLIILSNSSKRLSNSIKMLKKLGFDPDQDFDQIITSGDVSHRMLSGDTTLKCSTWDILQNLLSTGRKNVFVFGSGDGDEEYCTSSGWKLSSIDDADLIIARGTFTINDGSGQIVSKEENEEEYFNVFEKTLEQASKRKVPMLVTNPDKVRPDKGLPPMPGAIGDAYEKYLGSDSNQFVKRIGKPYSEVYELALNECNDTSAAVMVGDALETDITGGKWCNIDTLWVVDDGIHSSFVEENGKEKYEDNVEAALEDFNNKKGYEGDERLIPTSITKHFQW
jgi:HAD superfamily hydrolase (TIGR01450 family)